MSTALNTATTMLANTTLSGSNLVATSTAQGGARAARPLTGPTYGEATITTLTGTPAIGFASTMWGNSTQLGTDFNTIGYLPSGAVKLGATTLATIAAYVQGNRIDWAIDPTNRFVWFRVAGGNWNNNALNDPATGVGGIDFGSVAPGSNVGLGTLVPAISASVTGNVWTVNYSGAFAGTVPTGFIAIDTVQFTLMHSTDSYEGFITGLPISPGGQLARAGILEVPGRYFFPAGTITVVSGTVMEVGVVQPNKRVDVYDRITGELLGTAYSDISGNWSIPCLGRPSVRVVADDPTTFNSLVYDNVVPF